MKAGKFLFLLVCLMQFMSCQKAGAFVFELEMEVEIPQRDTASRDSTLKIAIIGDSISSFSGSAPSDMDGYEGARYQHYYPKGDVKSIENMWWYKTSTALGITLDHISNCSWSGSRVTGNSSSTSSASAGCSTRRITDLSFKGFNPDIVLCFISCNDWAHDIPMGNWSFADGIPAEGVINTSREAYALMLSKIKERYPSCVIACLTNLDDPKRDYTPGWPSNNRRGVTVDDWNKSISELAEVFGCFVIDLQECGISYDNAPSYTVDGGLHPNDAGMTLIAKKVATELAEIIGNNVSTQADGNTGENKGSD